MSKNCVCVYPTHHRHRRGVPFADVRVEVIRSSGQLRSDDATVDGDATAAPHRSATERVRRDENGAYHPHSCHARGVPFADVRVEAPPHIVERLRAEDAKVDGGPECS
jgi:hypothetical protein